MKKIRLISTLMLFAAMLANAVGASAQLPMFGNKGVPTGDRHKEKNNAQMLRNAPATIEGRTAESIKTRSAKKPATQQYQGPSRVPAAESNLFGYSSWSPAGLPIGMYTLGDDGISLLWKDENAAQTNMVMNSGFYLEGKLYGINTTSLMGLIISEGWIVMDMDNGEVVKSEIWDLNEDPTWTRMTYNPNDGYIYGQAYLAAEDGNDVRPFVFLKAPLDNPTDYEIICNISGDDLNMSSVCFNEVENALYAINIKGELIKVTTDGQVTKLFNVGLSSYGFNPTYFFGMVYNPTDNLIHFNPNSASNSYLATINAGTQAVDVYHEIEAGNQLMFMTTKNQWVKDHEAPQAPTAKDISFPEGATSGYIIYQIPSKKVSGEILTGTLKASSKLDGEAYGEYDVQPGSTLKIDYTGLSVGKHNFSLQLSQDEHTSVTANNSLWIGKDTPKAPANVVLTNSQVTWDAVTEAVHGGYIDINALSYKVYINGEEYGTTKGNSLNITVPEEEPMQIYRAEVTCSFGDLESEKTMSNNLIAGGAWNLPVFMKPTYDDFLLCTVLDSNNDGKRWSYWMGQDAFATNFSDDGVWCDDWLIIPPVKIDSSEKYIKLAFDTNIMMEAFPEDYMEVYAGTEPTAAAMTTKIIDKFKPAATAPYFARVEKLFKVPASGNYYIGFHWISEPMQGGMYLKNIEIVDNNVTDNSPSAPTDITAQAFERGELKATVTLTLPTKTLAGADIAAGTTLTANVKSEAGTASVTGKPGETVSVVVDTKQSENTLVATASLDGFNSPDATVQVYTGVVFPAAPVMKGFEVKPDMSGFTMEWEPVTTGVNGGYINPETVTYSVYKLTQEWYGTVWADAELNIQTCSFTYDIKPGDEMEMASYGVCSYNEAGSNGEITYIQAMIGTPYTLPIEDNFKNGQYSFKPWMSYKPTDEYNAQWGLTKISEAITLPGVDENAWAMAGIGEDTKGKLGMPRFSTVGKEGVTLSFDYLDGRNCPTIKLYAEYYGCEKPVEIGEIKATTDEYRIATVNFNLPAELMGKDWVQVYLETQFVGANQVVMLPRVSLTASNGIESVNNSSISVKGSRGSIEISGCNGDDVAIYMPNGMTAARIHVQDAETVSGLQKGIYLVRINHKTYKVTVK